MSIVRFLILLSLLTTQTAIALTPAQIQILRDQARGQAKFEAAKDRLTRLRLRHEIDFLLLDLQAKENVMSTNHHIEQVSIVISTGLAAYLGYAIFKPTKSGTFGNRALMDIGERILVGSITSVGLVAGAGTGGLIAYRTTMTPEQFTKLRIKLLDAKAELIAADNAQ